ncbi:MAG: hypothetical protein ACLPN1_08250 [Dissulfurispiraceae bacterium]
MAENKCIGKVTATESKPTTCTTVNFWLHPEVIVRPFDIVRIEHIARAGAQQSLSYAIVRDLSYITDSMGHLANYVSSDFGNTDVTPMNERLGTTIAEADVLSNNQSIEMPVRDGSRVEWAGQQEIRAALGVDKLKVPISAGYIETSNGEEICIDFEARYLIGPEAAHFNISGISGLASKTSYAMFLLSSLQQRLADGLSIILFNVKGPDLLAIDQANTELSDHQKREWKKCGLIPAPLKNVTYLYPYSKKLSNYTSSHVPKDVVEQQISDGKAFNYYYDVETFTGGEEGIEEEVSRDKISLLFSDIDDPNSTMESCIHSLGEIQAKNWESFRDEIRGKTGKGQQGNREISVQSWRKFSRLIQTRTAHDLFSSKYVGEDRRQKLIIEAIKELRPGKILVIDIAPLPDFLQCLVFGDVIRTVFDAKLNLYPSINSDELGKATSLISMPPLPLLVGIEPLPGGCSKLRSAGGLWVSFFLAQNSSAAGSITGCLETAGPMFTDGLIQWR